jgi:hypothetical protein
MISMDQAVPTLLHVAVATTAIALDRQASYGRGY